MTDHEADLVRSAMEGDGTDVAILAREAATLLESGTGESLRLLHDRLVDAILAAIAAMPANVSKAIHPPADVSFDPSDPIALAYRLGRIASIQEMLSDAAARRMTAAEETALSGADLLPLLKTIMKIEAAGGHATDVEIAARMRTTTRDVAGLADRTMLLGATVSRLVAGRTVTAFTPVGRRIARNLG